MQVHPTSTIRELGFQKGYNDTLPPEELPPGYLADALNCFIRTNEIVKRTGYTALGASLGLSVKCQGLKGIRFANGTKELVAVFNGSIYKYTGSGNFTLITSGSGVLSTSAQVEIVAANNNLYFFDGTSTVPKYNGTAISTVAAIPKGTGAKWFHNILCVYGMSATPNNVQLSDVGDPENFTTGIATTIGISPNDGDYIVTATDFNNELLILKSQHSYSLSGFSTASLTVSNLNDRIPFGTIALKGLCSTGSEVLYISFRGDVPHIRSIKRSTFGVIVEGGIKSEAIEATMRGLNKSGLNLCAAIYDGRNAWFALTNGSSTTNNLIIMLDTVTGGWVRHTGINAACFEAFLLGTSAQIFFGEATASAKAYVMDTSTSDNGTAIAFSVTSRRYGGNMPEAPKKWRYIYINAKETGNYNLTIDYAVDGFTFSNLDTLNLSGSGSMFDSIILDSSRLGSTDVRKARYPFPRINTYYLQMKMYETSATSSVTLRDWEIMYFPRNIRHT
jgi:hypothetical protein